MRFGFKKLLRHALTLAACLLAMTTIVNLPLFDEALRPELASALTPRPVSMEDNAFAWVVGFGADSDRAADVAGSELIERLRERYRNGQPITVSPEEISEIFGEEESEEAWRSALESRRCSSRYFDDCYERLIAEVAVANLSDPRFVTLLDRYETLLGMSRYEEMQEIDASTPFFNFGLLQDVGRTRLSLSYLQDPTAVLLDKLREEIGFWNTVLTDGEILISRLVAAGRIRQCLEFLSVVVRERAMVDGEIEALEDLLLPLLDEPWDLGNSFVADFRSTVLTSRARAAPISIRLLQAVASLLSQRNATLNAIYETRIEPDMALAALDAYELEGELRRGRSRVLDASRLIFYNPGSELLAQYYGWDMAPHTSYIGRMHDLRARVLLGLLQLEIERFPDRRAGDIVNLSAYRNPYSREPMDYDEADHSIGFECRQWLVPSDGHCRIRL